MKIPALLRRVQAVVKATVNPDLFDKDFGWIGQKEFDKGAALGPSPSRGLLHFRYKAAFRAWELLSPFAPPECQDKKRRWKNFGFCPPTPLGDYSLTFTVQLVLAIIDMPTPLVEGFKWWKSHGEPYRDANPYRFSAACELWDYGYIIGHCNHHHKGKIEAWCAGFEKAASI